MPFLSCARVRVMLSLCMHTDFDPCLAVDLLHNISSALWTKNQSDLVDSLGTEIDGRDEENPVGGGP